MYARMISATGQLSKHFVKKPNNCGLKVAQFDSGSPIFQLGVERIANAIAQKV